MLNGGCFSIKMFGSILQIPGIFVAVLHGLWKEILFMTTFFFH